MYNKKDFPNLPKFPNNNEKGGNLVFTRTSVSRITNRLMLLTAFSCGVMYVLSAYNAWKEDSENGNNLNRNNNGK